MNAVEKRKRLEIQMPSPICPMWFVTAMAAFDAKSVVPNPVARVAKLSAKKMRERFS